MTNITSFFTEKGGTGKTTSNILYASYLAYKCRRRVIYIDCDYPSYHAWHIRRREAERYESSPRLYETSGYLTCGDAYPVQKVGNIAEEADLRNLVIFLEKIRALYDDVVIDLPGSMNSRGINHILSHGIISRFAVILELDRQTIVSDIRLAEAIRRSGSSVALFWNRVYGRENREQYRLHTEAIMGYGLSVLPVYIRNSVMLRREVDDSDFFLRSTLSYPERQLERYNINFNTLFNHEFFR